jgi:hypothetical protein
MFFFFNCKRFNLNVILWPISLRTQLIFEVLEFKFNVEIYYVRWLSLSIN